jgi:hypothetical protein
MQAIKHHHEKGEEPFEGQAFASHAYQMRFVKANPTAKIIEKQQFPDYQNYYVGSDSRKWANHVQIFGELWYENLYEGVDMNIYGIEEGLKYNFMLQPNINPNIIQLQYEGISDISIKKGNLILKTAFTEVKELAPVAYQVIGSRKIEVACKYVLNNNIVSFSFPNGYDKSKALTIDPTVIFSTYTGSTQDNRGFTATYDNVGNGYGGGVIWQETFGQTGYPLLGAFQTSYQGGKMDVAITKFNSTGYALVFSTYLGGNLEEQPHSLVVDSVGNLFVLGRTTSLNFPKTAASYDTTHNGGFDMYVTKFSANGQLLASTFVGGTDDDGVNITSNSIITQDLKFNSGDDARSEILIDKAGNCIFVSCSKSSNFPTNAGGFQPTFSGVQDGVVVKLSQDLSTLMWSSYLGGSLADAAYSLQTDNLNQIYVTGGTMSTDFPVSTSGVLNTTYQGSIDGFIAKISADGTTLLKSSYLGTNDYDQSYFVQLDKFNDVYVLGQSKGAFPVVGNVYSNANGKVFICKLDSNFATILMSTVLGNPASTLPNFSPTAFGIDECFNVYIAGWGGYNSNSGGTNGLPVTPGAYDMTTDNQDLYFAVLRKDFESLGYATFFGGVGSEHADGGTSRFDTHGVLYQGLCGSCGGGNTFPTTAGAYSSTNNSTNCNLALVKMDLAVSTFPFCYPTNIEENESNLFSLKPNPAQNEIRLKFAEIPTQKTKISIQNIMGVEVYSSEIMPNNVSEISIPVLNLANGTYICLFLTEGRQSIQRFVVLR